MLEHIVLLPIFVVMGFWWWLLIIAASCFVIWSLEYDNLFSATATLLGTIVLMTVFGSSQLLEYMLSGWGTSS
jgi:cobalamin biosynthesis protein CobD/CbiB